MSKVDLVPVADVDIQLGLLLAVLDDVTNEWTEELGTVSDEAVVWQPQPQRHSIGALILHIADVESFWIQEVGAGKKQSPEELQRFLSEETNQYAMQWPIPPVQPLEWFLEQHRAIREQTRQCVLELNNPEHIGRYKDKEYTLRWLLNHVISHEAYHGGQAVLLSILQNISCTGR